MVSALEAARDLGGAIDEEELQRAERMAAALSEINELGGRIEDED